MPIVFLRDKHEIYFSLEDADKDESHLLDGSRYISKGEIPVEKGFFSEKIPDYFLVQEKELLITLKAT